MDRACWRGSGAIGIGPIAGSANAGGWDREHLALRAFFCAVLILLSAPVVGDECVIVLHGLARTSSSMGAMTEALTEAGFVAINIDYPSREYPIEELAPMAIDSGLVLCEAAGATDKIHFVAHSLGGILVRKYLIDKDIEGLGRVVMLGPPNRGSKAVDELGNVPGVDWVNGPAGRHGG